jgi:O-antigen ligase
MALVVLATLVGAALVWGTAVVPATRLLPAVIGGFGGLAIIMGGPVWCLAAIGGLATLASPTEFVRIGPIDIQLADVFYVALLVWVAARAAKPSRNSLKSSVWLAVRGPLFFLVAYIGLSVLRVTLLDPSYGPVSMLSWLRLVQTASLAWIATLVIRSPSNLRVLLSLVTAAGVLAVGAAVVEQIQTGGLSEGGRFGGFLNPNTLGLVSGLLIVVSVFGGISRRGWLIIVLVLLGLVGLFLGRSVGGIIGTVLTVSVGLLSLRRLTLRGADRALRTVLAGIVTGLVALGLIAAARPEVLPTSPAFRYSTASHRLVLASAGWHLFLQNPIVGVGWQRSASAGVIGDPEIAAALRDQFPNLNPYFFPDVSVTSVHNAYVQVLAELGLVGAVLFGLLVVRAVRSARFLRMRLRVGSVRDRQTLVLGLGLLLILIWWNDNPIFGGQTETMLAALFLGGLASIVPTEHAATPD